MRSWVRTTPNPVVGRRESRRNPRGLRARLGPSKRSESSGRPQNSRARNESRTSRVVAGGRVPLKPYSSSAFFSVPAPPRSVSPRFVDAIPLDDLGSEDLQVVPHPLVVFQDPAGLRSLALARGDSGLDRAHDEGDVDPLPTHLGEDAEEHDPRVVDLALAPEEAEEAEREEPAVEAHESLVDVRDRPDEADGLPAALPDEEDPRVE